MIIPYCNLLSYVFKNLIDENYVKSKNGNVDFSKTNTISIALRIITAEYLRTIIEENATGNSLFAAYPHVIIVASSSTPLESRYAYSISREVDNLVLNLDSLRLEKFSTILMENISNFHPDIAGVMGDLINYVHAIWIDERFSYTQKILTSHFFPPDSYQTFEKGKFIVDTVDYPVEEGSVEHFRIETISDQHILYRAIQSKLF